LNGNTAAIVTLTNDRALRQIQLKQEITLSLSLYDTSESFLAKVSWASDFRNKLSDVS